MGPEAGKTPPLGSWTHSREEDSGDVRVYRPTETYAFPPARAGRETLVFGSDGQLVVQSPGADDKPRAASSSWTPLSGGRIGVGGMPGAPEQVFEVIEATPDVLKLRKR